MRICSNPVDRHNTSNDERNQSDSEDALDDEVQSPQNNAQPVEVVFGIVKRLMMKCREEIGQIVKQHSQIETHQSQE